MDKSISDLETTENLGGEVSVHGEDLTLSSDLNAGVVTQDIPDGGSMAWLQVFGAFFVWFNSWGIVTSFGEFQTYYTISYLPQESPSSIAWIGSIQCFLLLFTGAIAGRMYDMGYIRFLIGTGSFFTIFGLMMTSLGTSLWQLILSQGICVGFGIGLMFHPSVAVMTQYFSTKRAQANGLASLGSGLGGIIYPAIFHRLQPSIGFGWTVRTIGFIAFATQIPSIILLRNRVKLRLSQDKPFVDTSAFRDPAFMAICASGFLAFSVVYIPLVYLSSFSIQNDLVSQDLAFYLLSILNAASLLGRITFAILADRYTGIVNMQIVILFVSGTLLFAWLGVRNVSGLMTFTVFEGLFTGATTSISSLTPVRFCPNLELAGTRIGLTAFSASLGMLWGLPTAGALVRNTTSYVRLQVLGGSILYASLVFAIVARLLLVKGRVMVKV